MDEPIQPAPNTALFAGQVAVVTGAGKGIGRAIAEHLSRHGAAVAIIDVDERAGKDTAEAIAARGGSVSFEATDLADTGACEAVMPRVLRHWQRVDVLVNNAAQLGRRSSILDATAADWQQVLGVNLVAAALLSRDAARDMSERSRGAIVNVTSIQEHLPVPTHAAYVASKGGISGLTRAMAVDLAPMGIRVNAVAPGVIDTPSMDDTFDGVGVTQRVTPPSLLRRFGSTDEIAQAVAFLASPLAAFITGEVLRVDGGRSLSRLPDQLAVPAPAPESTRRQR